MVAAHDIHVNVGGSDRTAQTSRNQDVIDAPSHIALACAREVAPPGVMAVALPEQAEGIDEARIQKVLEAAALLLGEALAAAVGFRVRQIELGVGNIEVAAENHRLGLLEPPAVRQERRIPVLVTQAQAAQIILGVGCIYRDHIEPWKLGGDQASLLRAVALQLVREAKPPGQLPGKPIHHRHGSASAQNGRARVPLLQCRIPVLVIAGQIDLDLPPLGLGLLQTQNVGLVFLQEGLQGSLLHHGAYAVDIPRVHLHPANRLTQASNDLRNCSSSARVLALEICPAESSSLSMPPMYASGCCMAGMSRNTRHWRR